MSGTDHTQEAKLGGPAVILVDPQLGENIGAVARAMLNCGLIDLRLVRPRDGWPNPRAEAASSGAYEVLSRVRLFDTTADALAGLVTVYATTARRRDMVRPILTPHQAALEMRAKWAGGQPCGLLFGPERTGLVNDDVALADGVLTVPLNPAFCSLNLAQAVLLVGYEWFLSGDDTPPRQLYAGTAQPATKDDLLCLFDHVERELEIGGFFTTPEQRPTMIRNIRNLFHRMGMTDQEVRTFHGIVAALTGHKKPRE